MNSRLIAPIAAFLCLLCATAQPRQITTNIQVSEGPTPFIRFVNTSVSDVAGFKFAQFLIFPKRGRPRGRSRSAMRDLIWKRAAISIQVDVRAQRVTRHKISDRKPTVAPTY
jgi:hypothetical protein